MGRGSVFTEDFIKSYDEESDIGYLLVVDVEYPKNLHMLHSDLPFFPERMKINKCNKLVCSLNERILFCAYISIETSIKSWIKVNKGA